LSDLDIELVPDEAPADESVHAGWFDNASPDEQRRYLCLDMARMAGALPEKVVSVAVEMEKFLLGKRLKAVE
jgi:hypothetical protein